MKPSKLIVAFAVGVAVAAGIFVALQTQRPMEPTTAMVVPNPAPLPAFELIDQTGTPVDRTVFEGQWDLVFFGFTHCPDVCPTTLQVLAAAKAALDERGVSPLPRIVLVSVDPERDTPGILEQYIGYFGAGNLGITGTLDGIRTLTTGLGIYFEKQERDDGNYLVDHSAAVLLIDPQGRFSALFSGPHVVENYVHDLPILMGDS
jgi:protein SCO1/2